MRSSLFRRGALLAAFLALAGPAAARPVTDAEKKSLTETVARFDAAMKAKDFAGISQTIPPKVMDFIAKNAGMSVDDLRTVMIGQMRQTMDEVQIADFGMDLAKAETRELPDGTPFMLIPTETVIDSGGDDKVSARSQTLALLDGTAWYLLRVSDAQQVAILKQVYPGFAGEKFPAGTTEAVK